MDGVAEPAEPVRPAEPPDPVDPVESADPAPEASKGDEEPAKAGGPQPKAGKKKRTWQKVDLYNPAPYVAQKGSKKGGKGGDKGRGPDWEGGFKGRGKGKDSYGEAEPPKARDDAGKGPSNEGFRPATGEGDPAQSRPMAGAKGKQHGGSKNRDGKGKGKSLAGAPRKGFGGPTGCGAGAGLAAGPATAATGPTAGALGTGRGGAPSADSNEPGMETEGLRPPGPQRGQMPPGKGGSPQGGMVRVPMAMVPYPCGAAMSYGQGSMPYPMAAMYTMPCYPMASPTYFNAGSFPFMQGGGAGGQMQQAYGGDRQSLKSQVLSQIEYYFGDENLIKDIYLRSLMDEDGWVKLASLATFRLVRSMTTDLFVIADAIASSQKLELDPRGQHVRLKDSWHLWVLDRQGSQ